KSGALPLGDIPMLMYPDLDTRRIIAYLFGSCNNFFRFSLGIFFAKRNHFPGFSTPRLMTAGEIVNFILSYWNSAGVCAIMGVSI
ncbi:MAG: hypothetical protein IJ960_10780, partial [Oscillospiraceae bacterium]|nr:hypothetical protein [Oscillospiraceae bacterium]